jgi:mannosyltransferase OCH1-like enzyme/glycosyltransferase involved in cell wall biosynthesis
MKYYNLKFKLVHKDWTDLITVDEKNKIIKRVNDKQDGGSYRQNDRILMIYWDAWQPDLFYECEFEYDFDNKLPVYYHITFNNDFPLYSYITFIQIIDERNSGVYIHDFIKSRYYSIKDIDLQYDATNNDIISFNHILYTSTLFNKLYKKVILCDIDLNYYLISLKNDICYSVNSNFIHKGKYKKYLNRYKLILNDETIYIKNNGSSIVQIHRHNNSSEKCLYVSDLIQNIKLSNSDLESHLYFLNKNNIEDIVKIIEYYSHFDYNTILIDDISNFDKNDLYDDIIIYYYKTPEELQNLRKIELIKLIESIFEKYDNNLNNESKLMFADIIMQNTHKIDIRQLWSKNNSNFTELDNIDYEGEIPKLMHFIWIGNAPFPPMYEYYIQTWLSHHPDWTFCFWCDENIPKLVNQNFYDSAKHPAMKADILRYELLYFMGGVYVDSDFLCLRNMDELLVDITGFTGYESPDFMAIGLMGFKPHDPVLYQIIIQIPYNIINSRHLDKSIPQLTGPVFFTSIWNKYKTESHKAYPIDYFYSYTFLDKYENKRYHIKDENYAIHMWGYSWGNSDINNIKIDSMSSKYYITSLFLENYIKLNNNISESDEITILNQSNFLLNYNKIDEYLKTSIYFTPQFPKNKRRIVHIMGLFFTGGIERYLHYISKYGDHEKYEYYLLHISNDTNSYVYDINNMKLIDFHWDHIYLNSVLLSIRPDLIIDHYSIYVIDNSDIYKGICQGSIIYFVHSALCYTKNIDMLNITKCIHLYAETSENKSELWDPSWLKIKDNYYLTLGTEFIENEIKTGTQSDENDLSTDIIRISIIGRIAEEKISLSFLEKICNIDFNSHNSNNSNNILISIYGAKDTNFNKEYVKKFEELLESVSNPNIKYFPFTSDIRSIYKNTDLLLIPSSYETGSFTCLEAFSWGIPVFARNVYGLPYLIQNGFNGYLFNDDDEIIDAITGLKKTYRIFKNREDIINCSRTRFNIIDKITNLENIIDRNLDDVCKKNIIMITSIINCTNNPLSYYHTRSVFDIHTRYEQTLHTIKSVREKIPNAVIIFLECSDLSGENEVFENDIREVVDYYYNFYEVSDIRDAVNSPLKGYGEANLLLAGLEKIKENRELNYKNIFKLSGRYYLNDDFNIRDFNNEFNNFIPWDNSCYSYCTIFYKIVYYDVDLYRHALLTMLSDLQKELSIECCMYKYFKTRIKIMKQMNVSGLLATEGYLFSV